MSNQMMTNDEIVCFVRASCIAWLGPIFYKNAAWAVALAAGTAFTSSPSVEGVLESLFNPHPLVWGFAQAAGQVGFVYGFLAGFVAFMSMTGRVWARFFSAPRVPVR
jgi:hypothetical protein